MVEVREVIENSLIFNDDIWAAIYKDIKKYFSKMNIVGWFVSVPYRVRDDLKGIRKLHLDNFAGNDKVCFLTDRTENDEISIEEATEELLEDEGWTGERIRGDYDQLMEKVEEMDEAVMAGFRKARANISHWQRWRNWKRPIIT